MASLRQSPTHAMVLPTGVAVWMVAAVIALGTALAYAGAMWGMAAYRLLTDGALLVMWLVAGVGWGSLLPLDWTGRSRTLSVVTAAGMGLGGMSLAMLLAGLAGGATPWVAWGMVLGGITVGGGKWWMSRPRDADARPPRTWDRWHWSLVGLAAFAGIALVAALIPPGMMWGDEPHGYDVLEYHLQIPREWHEAGRITPLEHNVFSYFPFNVEMHFLMAMLLRGGPWSGMYLAQLMHAAFIGLTVAGIYGAVREMGGERSSAALAGLAAGTTPWMTLLAPMAYNEGGLLLFGTLSIAWMLKAMRGDRPMRGALLAGAMAGFACGSKLTGAPLILVGLPACALAVSIARWAAARREGLELRRCALLCGAFMLAGVMTFSPWLLRNMAWTGNPVFPEATGLFGRGHFTETQATRWKRAHSPREDQRGIGARLSAAGRQLLFNPGSGEESLHANARYSYLPIVLLGLGAFAVGRRRREAQLLLAMFAVTLIFWLGFTHLQSRFFVPAIPILAMLIGCAELKRYRVVAAVVVVTAGIIGFAALHARLMEMLYMPDGSPRAVLLTGTEQIDLLVGDILRQAPVERHLALAGDARAFLYRKHSMERLSYRTVFDVRADTPRELIPGWTEGAPPDAMVLVSPEELSRFARTYWGIPPLPRDLAERRGAFWLDRR